MDRTIKKFSTLLITFVILGGWFVFLPKAFSEPHDDHFYTILDLMTGGSDNEEANDELEEQLQDLEDKINEYEERIENLKSEEASLQREIDYSDSQIYLTSLKIDQSTTEILKKESEIERLATDIEDIKMRINKIIASIDYQEDLLQGRIRARYKALESSPLVVIFGSTTIENAVKKTEYLQVAEKQDQRMLTAMNDTKDAYNIQKNLFEEKKLEEELLKKQLENERIALESYKSDLDRQKRDKEKLLEETQNDEQKYQALLAQVQSEIAALKFALERPAGDGEDVEKGDVIGFMGNTGCSSGPHLHFGYVKNGAAVDPLPYLNDGDLRWPVDNHAITQYFGENYTFYMNNFGIPGHDALDIISTSQYSGAPIKAAKDGEVYYMQDSRVYCPWLNNSLGRGAVVYHDDGTRTIYWHLQN